MASREALQSGSDLQNPARFPHEPYPHLPTLDIQAQALESPLQGLSLSFSCVFLLKENWRFLIRKRSPKAKLLLRLFFASYVTTQSVRECSWGDSNPHAFLIVRPLLRRVCKPVPAQEHNVIPRDIYSLREGRPCRFEQQRSRVNLTNKSYKKGLAPRSRETVLEAHLLA